MSCMRANASSLILEYFTLSVKDKKIWIKWNYCFTPVRNEKSISEAFLLIKSFQNVYRQQPVLIMWPKSTLLPWDVHICSLIQSKSTSLGKQNELQWLKPHCSQTNKMQLWYHIAEQQKLDGGRYNNCTSEQVQRSETIADKHTIDVKIRKLWHVTENDI